MPMVDEVFNYKGYGVHDSHCRLRIWGHENSEHRVVLLSEMEDNKGTSVINDAEHIATEVLRKFNLNPYFTEWYDSHLLYFEGFPKEVMYSHMTMLYDSRKGEFIKNSVSWDHTTKNELQNIVREEIEDEGL